MFRAARLLLIFGLTLAGFADNITFLRLDLPVVEQRLQIPPVAVIDRVKTLHNQFRTAGCLPDQIVEQEVPGEESPNVICTLPGKTDGSIIIGAPLDYKSHGEEARVQWGGVAMLPLLAESLNSAPHRYSLIFIAFAGHDHNFAGANFYLKQLTDDQRRAIRGMVDLDHIGRMSAQYAYPTPDTTRQGAVGRRAVMQAEQREPTVLTKVLPIAAGAVKLPQPPKENSDIGATDARVFQAAGITSIVIHSPSFTTVEINHTTIRQERTELDDKAYYDTYNMLCVYALFLDRALPPPPRKQTQVEVAQGTSQQPPSQSSSQPGSAPVEANAAAPMQTASAASGASRLTAAGGEANSFPSTLGEGESSSRPKTSNAIAAAPGQTNMMPAPVSPEATFRATARLVQVDVVVTDKQGKPVSGLQQSDFTVLQDGKPQTIHVFEAHRPIATTTATAAATSAATSAPTQSLPANVYSNIPQSAPNDSWTIILFDLLNTPTADQQYAHKQLMEILRGIPKGRPVALYMLTSRLVMAQGFTDDPATLVKAGETLLPSRSKVLTTRAESQHEQGAIEFAAKESMSGANIAQSDNVTLQDSMERREQQLRDMESFQTEDRVRFTLDAMAGLARSVSGYPGRKNLIWLSGAFPIRIDAAETMRSAPWRNSADYQNPLLTTAALLTESRIAVYPVDVRGLQGRGVDISTSDSENGSFAQAGGGKLGSTLQTQAAGYNTERSSMMEVAEKTGGHAFLNGNDIRQSITRSMEDGETYYTLAYTPSKNDEKTVYHRIEVKTSQPGVKLAYRRGYYSQPQAAMASPQVGIAALRGSLQPGMPQSTMLLMKTRVLPPDASHKDVRIDYIIDPNGVTFTDVAGHKKQVTVDCLAIAFDREGHEAGHASNTLEGTIAIEAYDKVMAGGLPAHQELSLPPGIYNLRLGVMDRVSQQIGTVDVPLIIDANIASKQPKASSPQ